MACARKVGCRWLWKWRWAIQSTIRRRKGFGFRRSAGIINCESVGGVGEGVGVTNLSHEELHGRFLLPKGGLRRRGGILCGGMGYGVWVGGLLPLGELHSGFLLPK